MATYKRPNDGYDFLRRLDGADLTLEERAVLFGHYRHGDKDGTNCNVSEERLASDLNVSVRTIRRHRKGLKAKGYLVEREPGRDVTGRKTASRMEVVIPTPVPIAKDRTPKKPTNPTGRNQHSKPDLAYGPRGQILQNPREKQAISGHLPTLPKIDGDNEPSNLQDEGKDDAWGAPPERAKGRASGNGSVEINGLGSENENGFIPLHEDNETKSTSVPPTFDTLGGTKDLYETAPPGLFSGAVDFDQQNKTKANI